VSASAVEFWRLLCNCSKPFCFTFCYFSWSLCCSVKYSGTTLLTQIVQHLSVWSLHFSHSFAVQLWTLFCLPDCSKSFSFSFRCSVLDSALLIQFLNPLVSLLPFQLCFCCSVSVSAVQFQRLLQLHSFQFLLVSFSFWWSVSDTALLTWLL